MNRRFLVAVSLFFIIVVLILIGQHASNKTQGAGGEGNSGYVSIQNTAKLQDLLLDSEFYAVQVELSDYIQSTFGSSIQQANIIDGPTVPDNGIIVFGVKTSGPVHYFSVRLDRQQVRDSIVFYVQGTGYKKTLNVYAPTSGE